jgi:signal transduction histidine kinase
MGEERRPGQELREEELSAWCTAVADLSPMPMAAVVGPGHILKYVNPAFCLLTGATKEELSGRLFAEAAEVEAECLSLLDRVYRTGTAEAFTAQGPPATNRSYRSCVMWPLVPADGERSGIMIQLTETIPFRVRLTEMNQALIISSVRQHELAEESGRLNAELRRANEDLTQFAFAASHDLQEPLRMITSYSQLLIHGYRGQLDGDAEACVGFINDGTRHMRDLLADLLSYAEVNADIEEPPEPVDLNVVFERVMQNLSLAIADAGAVVRSATLPVVDGPKAPLLQLLQNLIGNAIKYHGPDSPLVQVSAKLHDGEWLFAVKDNGMGIEPEYHRMIFGIFKRLHGKAIPGTGMGLAICQRVVQRLGGRIWVESEPGRGTTFYFTLPIRKN